MLCKTASFQHHTEVYMCVITSKTQGEMTHSFQLVITKKLEEEQWSKIWGANAQNVTYNVNADQPGEWRVKDDRLATVQTVAGCFSSCMTLC